MRTAFGIGVAVLLLASPAAAQQVYVDYDRDVNHSSYKTFDWVPTPETSLEEIDPVLHSQVKNAIELYLTEGGLIEAEMTPDLLVTYHTEVVGAVRLDTADYGFDYGPGWVWDPEWGVAEDFAPRKVKTYPQGTLIIDIWDLKANRVVWRGTVLGIVPEDPSSVNEEIHAALRRIVERWREMRPILVIPPFEQ